MKKITTLIVFAMLALPAFAEDTNKTTESIDVVVENIDTTAAEKSVVKEENIYKEKSNSDIKFPNGLQFGVGVSATSGVNGFVGYANKNFDSFWWKRLGLRFDFATTAPIESAINSAIDSAMGDGMDIGDGITINDGTITARHFGALVDFYPFGDTWFMGGWRLTGGYMFGRLNVAANLTSNVDGVPLDPMEFELNGESYRYPGGDIDGSASVNWNYSGPYLGTGFDIGLIWGIKIYMDAGAVFTNKTAAFNLNVPITGLEHWNGTAWELASLDSTSFEQDKADALKEANDELGKIKIYPMVKLGFMYRF
ncbi:MAG: hypothetical protein JW974_03360 [Alphaproteobacteria bacterium]|nr:hypothetical protein [Alphaproteobacteria bacterium]MBN2675276.1 hypothetical protein [Alphaproteobacteria bacterium]